MTYRVVCNDGSVPPLGSRLLILRTNESQCGRQGSGRFLFATAWGKLGLPWRGHKSEKLTGLGKALHLGLVSWSCHSTTVRRYYI